MIGQAIVGGGISKDEKLDFCAYLKRTYKNKDIVNIDIPSETPLLKTPKKSTKSRLLHTTQLKKLKRSMKKKLFEIFTKNKILVFYEFISENIFQSFLRGRETTRKKIE